MQWGQKQWGQEQWGQGPPQRPATVTTQGWGGGSITTHGWGSALQPVIAETSTELLYSPISTSTTLGSPADPTPLLYSPIVEERPATLVEATPLLYSPISTSVMLGSPVDVTTGVIPSSTRLIEGTIVIDGEVVDGIIRIPPGDMIVGVTPSYPSRSLWALPAAGGTWELFDPQPIWSITGQGPRAVFSVDGHIITHDEDRPMVGVQEFAHYDPDTELWTYHNGPTNAVSGISGVAHDSVWACDWNGDVWYWNGSVWTRTLNLPFGYDFADGSIYAATEDDVWVAGGDGTKELLYHHTGSSWSANLYSDLVSDIGFGPGVPRRIMGFGPNEVYLGLTGGRVCKWDGSSWSVHTTNLGRRVIALWGLSGADLWCISYNNLRVHHWDGVSWSQQYYYGSTNPSTQSLFGVTPGPRIYGGGEWTPSSSCRTIETVDGSSWVNMLQNKAWTAFHHWDYEGTVFVIAPPIGGEGAGVNDRPLLHSPVDVNPLLGSQLDSAPLLYSPISPDPLV